MRFLLGMMIGAGVILALAQGAAGDIPWQQRAAELGQRALTLLERSGAGVREKPGAAGEAEPEQRAKVEPRDPDLDLRGPDLEAEAPDARAAMAAPATLTPAAEPAESPLSRPPDPVPAEPPGRTAASETSGRESSPEQWPAVAVHGEEPVTARVAEQVPEQAVEQAMEDVPAQIIEPAADGAGSQPVWVPFHSEMSASGFAERLTVSLDHPFRVERRGPGRYQVVFGYTDEPEREALLAEAVRVTGLPL